MRTIILTLVAISMLMFSRLHPLAPEQRQAFLMLAHAQIVANRIWRENHYW
jgi:hypothetical protein